MLPRKAKPILMQNIRPFLPYKYANFFEPLPSFNQQYEDEIKIWQLFLRVHLRSAIFQGADSQTKEEFDASIHKFKIFLGPNEINSSQEINLPLFKTLAHAWFSQHLEIFKKIAISSVEQGIDLLIKRTSLTEWDLKKQDVADLYANVDTITNVKRRNQFTALLEKHWPNPIIQQPLSDASPPASTSTSPLNANDCYLLYLKHTMQYRYRKKSMRESAPLNDLHQACQYLVNAAILGHEKAQAKLPTLPQKIPAHETQAYIDAEFISQIQLIPPSAPSYADAQRCLFIFYYHRQASSAHVTHQQRIQNIYYALHYLLQCEPQFTSFIFEKIAGEKLNYQTELSQKAMRLKYALYIFTLEMTGENILHDTILQSPHSTEKENNIYYPYQILSKKDLDTLLNNILYDTPDKFFLMDTLSSRIKEYSEQHVIKINCSQSASGNYLLQIKAGQLKESALATFCFIDTKTEMEIARIKLTEDNFLFQAYGDPIHLVIDDTITASCCIFENPHANLHLYANFLAEKNLNFTTKSQSFTYRGSMKSNQSLDWIGDNQLIILAAGEIRAKTKLAIQAPDIQLVGGFYCDNICQIETEQMTINKLGKWEAAHLVLHAKTIKNYSPKLKFHEAHIHAKDTVTNFATGIIETKKLLHITGESVWNSGQINFGAKFIARLNKLFMHGIAEIETLEKYVRHKGTSWGSCITGEYIDITAAAYFNLFSLLSVRTWSLTTLFEVNLGVCPLINSYKSRIFSLDLGAGFPHFLKLAQSVSSFVFKIQDGDYESLLDIIFSWETAWKICSSARWMAGAFFPQFEKPINLAWSTLTVILSAPQIVNQVYALYQQEKSIEPYQVIGLLTTASSIVNQGLIIQSQVNMLNQGLGNANAHHSNSIATVALNAATLFLPFSTNQALFDIRIGGFQAAATLQNRSLFSYSFWNTQIALNMTEMFYQSYQQQRTTITYNQAEIGFKRDHSGRDIAKNIFIDVEETNENGTMTAEQVILQTQELNFAGVAHASNLLANASDQLNMNGTLLMDEQTEHTTLALHGDRSLNLNNHAHIQGNNTTAVFSAENINSTGDINIDQLNIIAQQELHIAGQLKSQEVHAQSRNMLLDGDVEIQNLNTQPDHPNFILHADESLNNHAHIQGNNTTAVFSAENINSTGDINIDQLNMIATTELNLEGHINTDEEHLQAEQIHDATQTFIQHIYEARALTFSMSSDSSIHGNGNFLLVARDGTLSHINMPNVSIQLDHIPNIQELISEQSQTNIIARDSLSLLTHDDIILNTNMNLTRNIMLSGNTFVITGNIHSTKDIIFISTQGDIQIKNNNLWADGNLMLDSHGSLNSERAFIFGGHLYIRTQYDAVNTASTWQSPVYLQVTTEHGDIVINSVLSRVTNHRHYPMSMMGVGRRVFGFLGNQINTKMQYELASIIGGTGEENDGIGLFLSSGNNVLINAVHVLAPGNIHIIAENKIISIPYAYQSISYHKTYSGFMHFKEKETTVINTTVYSSLIASMYGRLTLVSNNNSITLTATQLLSLFGSDIYARENINLYDLVTQQRTEKSESSWWKTHYEEHTNTRKNAIPTVIANDDPGVTRIHAEQGDVNLRGVVLRAPGLTEIYAKLNIHFFPSVLRQSSQSKISGLQIAVFGVPVFGGGEFQLPSMSADSTYLHLNRLAHSHGWDEIALNTLSSMTDLANTINILGDAYNRHQLASALSERYFGVPFKPEINFTYRITRSQFQFETVGPGELLTTTLTMDAGEKIILAVPVVVQQDMTVHAETLIQEGVELHSQSSTDDMSVTASVSPQPGSGVKTDVGLSASGSQMHATYYMQQQLSVGGTLTVRANTWIMKNSQTDTEKLDANINTLEMISSANTTDFNSHANSINTNGSVTHQQTESHTVTLDQPTTLHVHSDVDANNFTAKKIESTGAKFISDGKMEINPNQNIEHGVNLHVKNKQSGFSFKFFSNHNNHANTNDNSIPTINFNQSTTTIEHIQHGVIGDSHSSSNSGLITTHQEQHQRIAEIPILDAKGTARFTHAWERLTGHDQPSDETKISFAQLKDVLHSADQGHAKDIVKHMVSLASMVYQKDFGAANLHTPGLHIAASYEDEATSTHIAVYVDDASKEAYIAFRGADGIVSILTDCLDIALGQPIGGLENPAFQQFMRNQIRVLGNDGYNIYLTGHSRGAAQASVISSLYQLPAVVFDNPGLRTDNHYHLNQVISFQSSPNLINHIPLGINGYNYGTIWQLPQTNADVLSNIALNWLTQNSPIFRLPAAIGHLYQTHNIENIEQRMGQYQP